MDPARAVTADELHEILAALSLATDAANGLPFETALRTCLVAGRLADNLGLEREIRDAAFQAALMRFLGCTAFAHEESEAFAGDELAARRAFETVDALRIGDVARAVWRSVARPRVLHAGRVLAGAGRLHAELAESACEVGRSLALRLGFSEHVVQALDQLHERYDGRGVPRGRGGEDLGLVSRILHAARVIESQARNFGEDAVASELQARAGGHLDPACVRGFARDPENVLSVLRTSSVWDVALTEAPRSAAMRDLDRVTEVFADFTDLKVPASIGHSRRVADLAVRTGMVLALAPEEIARLRHAAHLHDLGQVGVANGIWEHQGSLSSSQWEQVRLHPYHTGRALERAPRLRAIARWAAAHHERSDGSGYPHGTSGAALPVAVRVLAAADVYAALREPRPHRPALSATAAVDTLRAEAVAGRLDARAVTAVLEAVGRKPTRRETANIAGLSAREVEVLCLVARGATNKHVGRVLGIAAKTVQHHVRHIYQKVGVGSRAAAALFAVEHGLLASEPS